MSLITNRCCENRKKRKVDDEIQWKKEILRRQKKQKNYWNKYEDYSLNSISDESNCDEFSLDLLNSNDKKEVMIEESGKEEGTCKSLGDDEKRVLLDDNKCILKLIYKKNTGGYFWEVKKCGSPAKKNWEIRQKKVGNICLSDSINYEYILSLTNKKQSPSQLISLVSNSSPIFKKIRTKFKLQR